MRLVKRTPEIFKQKQNIDVHIGHEALEIDVIRRRVRIRDLKLSRDTWEAFDHLVIATGALAIRPPVPGIDTPGVHGIKTLEDGLRLMHVLNEEKPRKAVIVGGGYIGIEMAEAMLSRGCEVSLIDMLPQVMGTLDADMAELVAGALGRASVTLHLGEKLTGFEESGGNEVSPPTSQSWASGCIPIPAWPDRRASRSGSRILSRLMTDSRQVSKVYGP
jgi:NADPH-dependent 2,4-dienoyl-CoA reductase/sulfur reductase-like enzyme